MPGGKGNIKSKDGKPFKKGNKAAEKWTEEKALQLGEDLISWLKRVDENGQDEGNIFVNEFLVINQDLHPATIDYLSKKFTAFSNLIGKAREIQKAKLLKYGVADRLNASMTKFVLINNHDMISDRSKQSHDIDDKRIDYSHLSLEEKKNLRELMKKARG